MIYANLPAAQADIAKRMKRAPHVHAQRWQGVDVSQRPEAKMCELLHEDIKVQLHSDDYRHYTGMKGLNLPWCDDHFAERICGRPINPGLQWKKWPWGHNAAEHLEDDGKFNHNYMERYWPKFAGAVPGPTTDAKDWNEQYKGADQDYQMSGIRYDYGDLNDLIDHLFQEPDTRQAYLPIFFPEDTGTMNPTRKPCTLGYHFILRHGYFHCTYYMRSCDFYRHWADDVYLTIRLHLWILGQLRLRDPETWNAVRPGFFIMHITSLHLFINDLQRI